PTLPSQAVTPSLRSEPAARSTISSIFQIGLLWD
ncbi:hypothetical protein ATR1_249c0001, partial [Acetobacter tropicalis]